MRIRSCQRSLLQRLPCPTRCDGYEKEEQADKRHNEVRPQYHNADGFRDPVVALLRHSCAVAIAAEILLQKIRWKLLPLNVLHLPVIVCGVAAFAQQLVAHKDNAACSFVP